MTAVTVHSEVINQHTYTHLECSACIINANLVFPFFVLFIRTFVFVTCLCSFSCFECVFHLCVWSFLLHTSHMTEIIPNSRVNLATIATFVKKTKSIKNFLFNLFLYFCLCKILAYWYFQAVHYSRTAKVFGYQLSLYHNYIDSICFHFK